MDLDAPKFGLRIRTGTEETTEGEIFVVVKFNEEETRRVSGPYRDSGTAELAASDLARRTREWMKKQGLDPLDTAEAIKRFGSEFIK